MKGLIQYIKESLLNEAALQAKDFPKHGYAYIKGLLSKLLSGEDVRLGNKGEEGHVNIKDLSNEEMQKAEKMLNDIDNKNYDDVTVEKFNEIFASKKLKLTSFFKGDYSGYAHGLASGNKGNAFESYFINNYHEKFEDDIKKISPYDTFISIHADGEANTKRPLIFSNDSITCGKIEGDDFNIGKVVTDVTVKTDKGEIYLSLKSGNSVTFVNAGIKKLFTKEFFEGEEPNKEAQMLLEMLSINTDKFREVFNGYAPGEKKVHKAEKETVDITDSLKSNKLFKRFMQSVMGYGYIMVHQVKSDDVEYIDLSEKKDLDKFIKDINKAYIEYPVSGQAKRIDIIIDYDEIVFKLNIRSKDGGILPTHIMADYKFKH